MNANDYLTMFFGTQAPLTPAFVAGSLALSFLLAVIFAAVYQTTFREFTYSRSYVHTMVLGSLVTCMLIMAVGSNLARLAPPDRSLELAMNAARLKDYEQGASRSRSHEVFHSQILKGDS